MRELFARPWAGPARLWMPWWLRWLPVPSTFDFRTEITALRGERWSARDTLRYPDGREELRFMEAEQVGPAEVRAQADDIPGGLRLRMRPDGFDFDPYRLRGPLGVRLRCIDRVDLVAPDELLDRIEMRLLGVLVGRLEMRLRPV